MPKQVTQNEFASIVENNKILELRIKNLRKTDKEGHYKLKLRSAKQLYTLKLKDQKKMKELVKIASDKGIAVKRID